MPEFEALARRALAAQERSVSLVAETQRLVALARLLRDAWAGEHPLVRCAWCGRFLVGDEWLLLSAVGRREQQIASTLLDSATHGICPDCFGAEIARTAAPSSSREGR